VVVRTKKLVRHPRRRDDDDDDDAKGTILIET